jgi:hypothetical protein
MRSFACARASADSVVASSCVVDGGWLSVRSRVTILASPGLGSRAGSLPSELPDTPSSFRCRCRMFLSNGPRASKASEAVAVERRAAMKGGAFRRRCGPAILWRHCRKMVPLALSSSVELALLMGKREDTRRILQARKLSCWISCRRWCRRFASSVMWYLSSCTDTSRFQRLAAPHDMENGFNQ